MRRLLVLGLVVATLTGCAQEPKQQAHDDGPPALQEPIPKITSSRQIVLPSYGYDATPEQLNVVAHAAQLHIRTCMERFHFEYQIPVGDAMRTGEHENGRYGLIDAPQAARYGHHPVPDSTPPDRSNASGTPDFYAVLGGKSKKELGGQPIPQGGCAGEGARKVGLDQLTNLEMTTMWNTLNARSQNDPRVVAAMGAWSACMKQAGYTFKDSWQANNDTRWGGRTVSPAEIATATADVRCKQQTNLVGIWMAVETAL
jgi:hypothetical protein